MSWKDTLLGEKNKTKLFFSFPATNCCNVSCENLHQWQSLAGFHELDRRSREVALDTHGGTGKLGEQPQVNWK